MIENIPIKHMASKSQICPGIQYKCISLTYNRHQTFIVDIFFILEFY